MVEANTESIIESHKSREVWAIVKGEGTVHSQGQDYPCKPGDVFFFDSFANHKVKNHSDHCMVLTSMWWPID
jgi:mannose-6-phosphate isomerase-like protein (cupin superfamily)